MNPADREGRLPLFFIEKPETIDEDFMKLDPSSSEGRYLGRLISWASVENKKELFGLLEEGLYMDEAYELQNLMIQHQMQPMVDFIPTAMWEIKWSVKRRVEIDDFYDRKKK